MSVFFLDHSSIYVGTLYSWYSCANPHSLSSLGFQNLPRDDHLSMTARVPAFFRMIAWRSSRNSLIRMHPVTCPRAPSMADTNQLWAPDVSWHFPPSVGWWMCWACRQRLRRWRILRMRRGGGAEPCSTWQEAYPLVN